MDFDKHYRELLDAFSLLHFTDMDVVNFKYKKEAKYFKQLSLVLGVLLISVVVLKSYHIFIQKY